MPTKRVVPKPAAKKKLPKKPTVRAAEKSSREMALGAHVHPYGTERHSDGPWQRSRLKKQLAVFSDDARETIERALAFAEERHKGQERKGGGPYVLHPIRIACILTDEWGIVDKPEVVAAALLHDVVEDTQTTLKEIKDRFGDDIGKLVDGMTMWKGSETYETYCTRVRRGSEMLRVIKCADTMDNLRSWHEIEGETKFPVWWRQAHDHVLPIARSVSDDITTLFSRVLDDMWYLKKAGMV